MAEREAAIDRMEVIRRWIDLTPSGDWVGAFHDETQLTRVRAVLEQLAVPDLEVEPMGPEGGGLVSPSRGADGLIAFWQDWLEPWETFTVEIEQVLEGPEGVLVEVVQQGRLRGSVAAVETRSAAVHFFRGDRLARIEFHLDRDRAREAAGLR